jgi:hypothetical protein
MRDRSNPPGFGGVARELPCRSLPPQYEPNARAPVSTGPAQSPPARSIGATDAPTRETLPLRPAPKP